MQTTPQSSDEVLEDDAQLPLVTIITITYNHAAYIGRALESFVTQKTEFPFEVLVADDCSTDDAASIIRSYAEKYPDIIKPILREENIGAEENFLCTAEMVRSKYVAICDGDDYFVDDRKLQKQVDVLEADDTVSFCCGFAEMIWEDGSQETTLKPPRGSEFDKPRSSMNELLRVTFMATSTIMYRWRFLDVPIRDHMPVKIQPGDYFLMFLHAEVGDIAFIDDVLSVYWRHDSGTWHHRDNEIEAHLLKHGMSELFFHYYVYRRFERDNIGDWKNRTVNALAGVVRTSLKHGRADELAQLAELGDSFFEEFGTSVVVEQAYVRKDLRRRRRRKRFMVTGVITTIVALQIASLLL